MGSGGSGGASGGGAAVGRSGTGGASGWGGSPGGTGYGGDLGAYGTAGEMSGGAGGAGMAGYGGGGLAGVKGSGWGGSGGAAGRQTGVVGQGPAFGMAQMAPGYYHDPQTGAVYSAYSGKSLPAGTITTKNPSGGLTISSPAYQALHPEMFSTPIPTQTMALRPANKLGVFSSRRGPSMPPALDPKNRATGFYASDKGTIGPQIGVQGAAFQGGSLGGLGMSNLGANTGQGLSTGLGSRMGGVGVSGGVSRTSGGVLGGGTGSGSYSGGGMSAPRGVSGGRF